MGYVVIYTFLLLLLSCVIYIILFLYECRRRLRENLRVERQLEKRPARRIYIQAKLRLFTNFCLHELRTPLFAYHYSRFEERSGKNKLGLPSELRERLGIIYKNARKLILLPINQMMDLKESDRNMQLMSVRKCL